MRRSLMGIAVAGALLGACKPSGGSNDAGLRIQAGDRDAGTGARDAGTDGGSKAPGSGSTLGCAPGASAGAVAAPVFVRNLRTGQTGWFASPVVADLDGDGAREIVISAYDTFVFGADGGLRDTQTAGDGRVYPPAVVGDLEGDGDLDVVVGRGKEVYAFTWTGSELLVKGGWPRDTTTAGQAPEVRGLAAADLTHDGRLRVIATTTQTRETSAGGAQVFVFNPDGTAYHPSARSSPDWPRYNALTGAGNDADRNDAGHQGYGCYGLNIGVGELDDDAADELVVTYDNHRIQLFDHDGVAKNLSPHFTNPESEFLGARLTWGQMSRWVSAATENEVFHDHSRFPDVNVDERLQWTQSPPVIVDLDGDGRAEVVAAPSAEHGTSNVTQAWLLMALEGAQNGGAESGHRVAGWETLPRGSALVPAAAYPPIANPAPAVGELGGAAGPELVVSLNDGYLGAYRADGQRLWRVDIRHGRTLMYATEPVLADLNQDGSAEIVVATYGGPGDTGAGRLMILSASGAILHDLALPGAGNDGNGAGAPAAPTIADLEGDGTLEILVQTFDHGVDVFRVPGSAANCLLWPNARGGLLRQGRVR